MQVAGRFWAILITMSGSLLTACSSPLTVQSDVVAYSTLDASSSIIKAPTYAFERLPSEREGQAGQWQAQMEHLASQALAEKGLRPVDQAASYQVHVSASSERYVRDTSYWRNGGWGPFHGSWYGSYGYYGRHWGAPWGPWGGWGSWGPWGWEPAFYDMPYATIMYRRTVGLTLRDVDAGHVVYETRALNDDTHADSDDIFLAMFRAALQGFPHPPQKTFQVRTELPSQ